MLYLSEFIFQYLIVPFQKFIFFLHFRQFFILLIDKGLHFFNSYILFFLPSLIIQFQFLYHFFRLYPFFYPCLIIFQLFFVFAFLFQTLFICGLLLEFLLLEALLLMGFFNGSLMGSFPPFLVYFLFCLLCRALEL